MTDPKIRGVKVQLGELELVMPAATVAILDDHEAAFDRFRAAMATGKVMDTREDRAAFATIAHAVLALNYPDLSLDDVRKRLGFGNGPAVGAAIFTVCGFEVKQGESASGEAVPQS